MSNYLCHAKRLRHFTSNVLPPSLAGLSQDSGRSRIIVSIGTNYSWYPLNLDSRVFSRMVLSSLHWQSLPSHKTTLLMLDQQKKMLTVLEVGSSQSRYKHGGVW